ncbi:MAG TPA: glycosyltransferase family 9 protein [Bryobacteraceae bacterium]|nr:glycosyltransferase family 9 protein [Bryobacteraceae bacterium]
MRSTSCSDIAQEVLDACLAGDPPKELPRALLEETCGNALFRILVEGLADRFEPALCDAYAGLFAQAVAHILPEEHPAELVARYRRIRRVRPVAGRPQRVVVLSRVTLGADVAVTSVLLDAARRRFPNAELVFAGPQKNYDLFAAERDLVHALVDYPRGPLRERLAVRERLSSLLADRDTVVLDPDSRLTQLGLLPVGHEDRYHLFESRSYGAASGCPLPELAADWAAATLGVDGAKPYVALARRSDTGPYVAVNLGVGENPAKRLPDPFEEKLLAMLAGCGLPIVVDKGGSAEEAARVERAAERSGAPVAFWEGSFAGFASIIAASRLYVGYDSAGQHVAAASGVPLISIFAGFPAPRMFERWRPAGPLCQVIRVDRPDVEETLERVREALRPWAEKAAT